MTWISTGHCAHAVRFRKVGAEEEEEDKVNVLRYAVCPSGPAWQPMAVTSRLARGGKYLSQFSGSANDGMSASSMPDCFMISHWYAAW